VAAIIQSESVFIDGSPLGEAAASRQTQQTSSIFELGAAHRGYSNDDLPLGKAGVERLLKRARIILNRAIATRVVRSELVG
jgi:hypothetical protein